MSIRGFSGKKKSGQSPVYLNVYDLTPINGYAYWLGLGVYHSGVQVHGVEYAYGAHDGATTGIFEAEPKYCPGFRFRKSVLIGRTELSPTAVRGLMEAMACDYPGNAYNLISKNCNHFCHDACLRLTGNRIPRWVNRLARIGLLCNCVFPSSIGMEAVTAKQGGVIEEANNGEQRKLRSSSNGFTNTDNKSCTASAAVACSTTTAAAVNVISGQKRRSAASLVSAVSTALEV